MIGSTAQQHLTPAGLAAYSPALPARTIANTIVARSGAALFHAIDIVEPSRRVRRVTPSLPSDPPATGGA